MALAQAYNGSELVSVTEWSLTTDTTGPDLTTVAGIYQAFIDLSALLIGDTFEFRIYEKVQAADTQRVCFAVTFSNAQGTDGAVWVSPALHLIHGWDMTLKKAAGTDRTITWSIRAVT